jgi:histidyl-tRNA synthetase
MIQAIRGTKDILPAEIPEWHFLEDVFKNVTTQFGYKEIRTPILELTEVFSRGIGEGTDIVGKEMYTFQTKGDKPESVTMRPEMTAAVVRAVTQHSLLHHDPTLRLWYSAPFFRYEKPQKGRQRQFHQFGAECIGSPNPESDAEVIILAATVLKKIGISEYSLAINSLGNKPSREKYRTELISFLKDRFEKLSDDSQNRLEKNPLRVLDSKDPRDREATADAPYILDFLDEDSAAYFKNVQEILKESGVKFSINPRLVRGLDYYNHTVFEFLTTKLGSQDALGGGGRYDPLFAQLGGKETPAVGFAMGIERLLLLREQENLKAETIKPDIFIIGDASAKIIQKLAMELRFKNLIVVTDLQRRSFKAQMKEANKLGARYSVIIGKSEEERDMVIIKNMETGTQTESALNEAADFQFLKTF